MPKNRRLFDRVPIFLAPAQLRRLGTLEQQSGRNRSELVRLMIDRGFAAVVRDLRRTPPASSPASSQRLDAFVPPAHRAPSGAESLDDFVDQLRQYAAGADSLSEDELRAALVLQARHVGVASADVDHVVGEVLSGLPSAEMALGGGGDPNAPPD